MANPKGNPQNLTCPGRPKGSKNKFNQIKDDILKAYNNNGGLEWLQKWALDNPGKFIDIATRLLPKEINVEQTGEITITHESASVSKVNQWIRPLVDSGVESDNEDITTERPLLPH